MTSEVYKLVRTDVPEDGTDVYVGSTSLSLKTRLRCHRGAAKVQSNKLYTRMYEVGPENWEILPLAICPCTEDEIRTLERQWVELVRPDLNTVSPVDIDNKWSHIELKEQKKKHYYDSIESKRYFCDCCDKAFGYSSDLKRHYNSEKHKDKSFEQLIEGVHDMIQEGTFSQALENSKETTL